MIKKILFSKICIASDHAGYDMKEKIKDLLLVKDIPVIDLGPFTDASVDYPDYADLMAKSIKSNIKFSFC